MPVFCAKRWVVLLLFAGLFPHYVSADKGGRELPDSFQIPPAYFGIHLRWGATTTPWPYLDFASWRVISPETEWRGLQPRRDVWRFEQLDTAVARARNNGVDILLSLGQTPRWASARPNEKVPNGYGASAEPANMADWENYLRTVMTRYKGKIAFYELWNEPYFTEVFGVTGRGHFTGSAVKMVEMAAIANRVRDEVDPEAQIVSPACVGRPECLDAFLSAGGKRFVDVIAFHFYSSPERITELAGKVMAVMKRHGVSHLPLWNTESGYLVQETGKPAVPQPNLGESFSYVLAESELPGQVLKSMVLSAQSGVSRYYHYSWDIPGMHVMGRRGMEPNAASAGFANVLRWLREARMGECQKNWWGLYSCPIQSKKGYQGWLLWAGGLQKAWQPPTGFRAIGFETLDGQYHPLNTTDVPVSREPILVRDSKYVW